MSQVLAAFFLGLSLDRLVSWKGRSKGELGVADELLWGLPLEDGKTVLNLDGSLSRGWLVECPDYMSITEAELTEVGRTVNDGFIPLVDRWLVNWDTFRVPAAGYPTVEFFPDPVSRFLDVERARRFGGVDNFVSRQVLVVTYSPPRGIYDRSAGFFVETAGPTARTSWQEHLDRFHQATERLDADLSRVFRMKGLSVSALAAHFRLCLTGIEQPVGVPEGVCLRDLVVAEDFTGGFEPRLGDRHIGVIGVRGFPGTPRPDASEVFHSFPFRVRSSARIYPLGRRAGSRLVNGVRLKWFNRGRSASKKHASVFEDSHAQGMAEDAGSALAAIQSGVTMYSLFTWTLVLSASSRKTVVERCARVTDALGSRGLTCAAEQVNATAAYFGSLPGHGQHNLRRHALSVRSIAELLSTTSPNLGAESCPSSLYPAGSPPVIWGLTEGSSPYRLHLPVQDTGHGCLTGRTRGGKSVLVGLLMLQALRWNRSQVFLFDVDHSNAFAAIAAGGVHYDIGSDEVVEMQPLADLETEEAVRWATKWLLDLLTVQEVSITTAVQADVEQALELLRADSPKNRTLTLFSGYAQESDVKAALRSYTSGGRYGGLLDAGREGLKQGRLQVFEVGQLLTSQDQQIILPVLSYLFWKVEQRLNRGVPSLVFIEEAWLALLNSKFSDRITSWLRRLAKLNCGVWLVTQSPEEILKTSGHKAVLDACQSRIFLPDPHALDESGRELYGRMGLNATEMGLLSSARAQRDYLHTTSDGGSRLFELVLGPYALALLTPQVGMTVLQMYRLALEMRGEYGSDWFREYLLQRGMTDAAAELRVMSNLEEKAA